MLLGLLLAHSSTSVAAATANGPTSSAADIMALTPPGNALAFDGQDDYVTFNNTPAINSLGTGRFTLEAWVYYNGGSDAQSIIRKDGDYNLYINGNTLHAEVWPSGMGNSSWQRIDGQGTVPVNRWTHVAAVWNNGTMQLFLNGALQISTNTSGAISATAPLTLGKSQVYGNLLNGRLDEVRIYNAALTQANIQADMFSTASAVPASLKLYLDFDQGTAGGSNTTVTSLPDQSSSQYTGTLYGFSLSSGNTISNWVESYALVIPRLTAVTDRTTTGFRVNWTAPAIGIVDDGYVVEVASDLEFTAPVAGSPFSVLTATSQAVAGLQPNTTYYYRVSANKRSVNSQGTYAAGVASTASGMLPPGNALAFDGNDDSVDLPIVLDATNFTFETWVNYQDYSYAVPIFDFFGSSSHLILRSKVNYGEPEDNNIAFSVKSFIEGTGVIESAITSTAPLPSGSWHHLAVTIARGENSSTGTLYLNGIIIGTNPNLLGNWDLSELTSNKLGSSQLPSTVFKGSLDEVRIYNAALTQAQIQADMRNTSAALPANLVAYYNFDQGTASGDNTGLISLTDQSGSYRTGKLYNFDLSGSISNWVESYALLQPTGLTVSAITGTSFTASWMAPTIDGAAPAAGVLDGYILDVSTSSNFLTGVTSRSVAGAGTTSQVVTGLAIGTDYYLRVRAIKNSLGDVGTNSVAATAHTVGTDAKLISLTPSGGAFSPVFATGTLSYTLYLPASISTYTLTPTASNRYTTITINGQPVTSGTASGPLSAGTTVSIVLTSEDQQATTTYTVQTAVAPGYFRSVASGNWGNASTWELSFDNQTWTAASVAPITEYAPTATVRNGHMVTVAAAVSIKTVTIESGGVLNTLGGQTLTVPAGSTLTVNAGGVLSIGQLSGVTSGSSVNYGLMSLSGTTALTVNGTLVLNTNSTTAVSQGISSTTTTIGSGGRVVQFASSLGVAMPAPTWSPGSTLELAGGVLNQTYTNDNQTLQNLEVNLTSLSASNTTSAAPYLLSGTFNMTVGGTLTVRSTGTAALRLRNTPIAGTLTLGSLDGNGNRTGGYLQLAGTNVVGSYGASVSGAGTPINVLGSFQLTGGTFVAAQANTTTVSALRSTPLTVSGDFTVANSATFTLLSGSTGPGVNYAGGIISLSGNFSNAGTISTGNTASTTQKLLFAKSGTQSFTNTGTISGKVNVQVSAGTTLDLGTGSLTGTGTFTTEAGSTLRLGSPAGISAIGTATGNVQSTGTRSFANGTSFEFNGTTAQVTGTGFQVSALNTASTLTFNNPAGVTLSQPLAVPGTLSLKQGVVTTSVTNLLTLGTSQNILGILDPTASNTGRVAGPLKRWVAATTGITMAFPVGTAARILPATVTYTVYPSTGGTLTAEFVATPGGTSGLPLTDASSGVEVKNVATEGFWRLTRANGLSNDGTYMPTFTFTGLGGASSLSGLVLLKRTDDTQPWATPGTHVPTAGTTAAPVLSRSGLSGFSDFTAGGSSNNPLPVELVRFTARLQGAAVVLRWATAQEQQSAYFSLERSTDGRGFTAIGRLNGQGTSTTPHDYQLTDANPGRYGASVVYYRLRQVDEDGTAHISAVQAVTIPATPTGLALYPNPARNSAQLSGAPAGAEVQVYDGTGRLIFSTRATAAGTATLALPQGLPAGVYAVRAGRQMLRLAVE
jgi:hypothetical protein